MVSYILKQFYIAFTCYLNYNYVLCTIAETFTILLMHMIFFEDSIIYFFSGGAIKLNREGHLQVIDLRCTRPITLNQKDILFEECISCARAFTEWKCNESILNYNS
jgi:hypothetical protein